MSDNTHAIGQLQGYMLQVRHMLFELISLEDIVVSLEQLDDVAVQTQDGSIVAEQIKSNTSSGNPITDRSVVFWKTLYNWHNYILNGSLELDKTTFRMVVMSNHVLEAGEIIQLFHSANTKKAAQDALSVAKISIWGENDELRSIVPDSYGKYLEVLFTQENEGLISQIIADFTLDVHENDYDNKLTQKFNVQPIPPEFADNLFKFMLGWVNDEVNKYANKGLPAVIKSIDYRKALTAQIRMYNQQNSIPALSSEIASDNAHAEVESQDVYIQQLDLIGMGFDDKLEAANDYLRTKAETTIRADKGLFTTQSLQNYNDRIRRLWKNKRAQIMLSSDSDITKGKLLYAQTNEAADDNTLPSFFGSGTLQALANDPCDEPTIGWHPNYKELFKGGGKSE